MQELDQALAGLAKRLGAVTAGPVALGGGITNRNYRVAFAASDCVVRFPGKDTSLLGISREAEQVATRAAAQLGISPALVDAQGGCLVTEYAPAEPSDAAAIRAAPELVARVLRRFHDSGVELPIRFWVPDLLDDYASVVRGRGGRLPGPYLEAHELARRIGRRLRLRNPVPCHNDLLPANVLRKNDGHVLLVDWEYAGMGHRLFDLGNLAAGSGLTEAEEGRLLEAYLVREPTPGEHAVLGLMRIMSDIREAAWGVVQGSISDLDFDFDAYAEGHFQRVRAAAADPRTEEWFDAAVP